MGYPASIMDRINPSGCSSEVGHGWYGIIERLDQALTAIDSDYRIGQIKEKYGRLRVYLEEDYLHSDSMRTLIQSVLDAAEDESSRTCEDCGAPGTVSTIRERMTCLCRVHAQARSGKSDNTVANGR